MRNSMDRNPLLVSAFCAWACLLSATVAAGQGGASKHPPASSLEVAATYDSMWADEITGESFWMQGGSVEVHGKFWHGLGVVGQVAGQHASNVNGSGVGLDLVTAMFGPRYTWSRAHSRYAFFGQALTGEAFGLHSTFPSASAAHTDADSLALQMGGGVNISIAHRLSLRAVEADWVRTQLPNSADNVQNNLRLGAGVVFRLP